MYISLPYDISNVWYNDAHRVIVFSVVFYLPFTILFLFRGIAIFMGQKKASIEKKNFISIIGAFLSEIFFFLTFLSFISGLVGLFQLVLPPIIDVVVRSLGLILYLNSILLFALFARRHRDLHSEDTYNKGFYLLIRHPYYSILIALSVGMSLSTVSILTSSLTVLTIVVFIIDIKRKEKALEKKDSFFIDYKYSTPMLIPKLKKIVLRKNIKTKLI
ncbi:MAG TPA: hypothetical protein PK385_00830 [Spirochaetota bacterium]|nr:hypothetical protein [Spirochaetota bacterium]HOS32142.1 hypothetical protein [Spirochaetota bacterium]HOS54582.1 hypothetical protein [Spirochaetota bacterium]HPK60895.1 hypothetical protein [Spirochaetota bacterium]HQF77080.1 hypothetical protein [Spirochaetota bacterium]